MNKRQFLTLHHTVTNKEVDIELPSDIALVDLLPEIAKSLGWPLENGSGIPLTYRLEDESGNVLESTLSCQELHLDNFALVNLIPDEAQRTAMNRQKSMEPTGRIPDAEEDSSDQPLPAPAPSLIPVQAPCLISEKGVIFIIGELPAMIGRKGSNSAPQIDLSMIDNGQMASRKHAELVERDDEVCLNVLKTKNGTLVNGTLLEAGTIYPLKNGDQIRLGFRGVELTYRC